MTELFGDEKHLLDIIQVEKALNYAICDAGLLQAKDRDVLLGLFDSTLISTNVLKRGMQLTGNPVIAIVRELSEKVEKVRPDLVRFVHYGATSQDIVDTTLVLQMKSAVGLMSESLEQLIQVLTGLLRQHTETVMIGRTLGQHARPITFGYKISGWLEPLWHHRQQIKLLKFPAQLGGAVGSLSVYGADGDKVRQQFARHLELDEPGKTFHPKTKFVKVPVVPLTVFNMITVWDQLSVIQ